MFLRASGERRLFCPGETAAGGENRARASLPCGTSNTCVMRLAGRGARRARLFPRGERESMLLRSSFCSASDVPTRGGENRTPCGGTPLFWGKIGADVGRNDGFGGQAASEVGQGVSGKPRQRAAVCNCNSKEGSAGDTPEKARPGVCRVSRSLFFPRAGNADARTRKRRFPRRGAVL